ncbi:NAD-binding protein [Hoeflea poritis]|uniref:NAD-binding protein n=1 Tax=Hoeflea poritis TaxID=2993659 RepID=A0ABT4VH61_9HYPH|nr:NAD-binding protein [Hoeflea poritis]MDA4844051.1 NAD-binding protein [Hoeflea poritis]
MDIQKLQRFNSAYVGDFPFLKDLVSEWAQTRPLEGIRILHNIPLTRETMLKLEPLYLGGADVTVTHLDLPGLEPKPECVNLLEEAGATLELNHRRISGTFDIALDCCAQVPAMENVRIERGYVELTQSGTPVYSNLETDLPIYSLDLSKLKCLEGMFGTGEACVRALKQFVTPDLKDRKIVLFGYGKVGRGIARYLSAEGANLTVVDIRDDYLESAASAGFSALRSTRSPELLDAINGSYAVIFATGFSGLLQSLFSPSEINDDVLLVNMGADDEFGDDYPPERVVANKAPLNFLLDSPTTMFFIDPIFTAHNRCCENILSGGTQGFSALPAELDLPLVNAWSQRYGIDVSDIYF